MVYRARGPAPASSLLDPGTLSVSAGRQQLREDREGVLRWFEVQSL